MERRTRISKRLRQTSLLENIASSPSGSSRITRSKPPKTTPSPAKKRKAAAEKAIDSGESSSSDVRAIKFEPKPPEEISSDSDDSGSIRPLRGGARKRKVNLVSSSSDSSDKSKLNKQENRRASRANTASKLNGRLGKENKKAAKGKEVHHDSPLSDEEDILDEVDEDRILTSRLRTRDNRTEFQKNLDKLRRGRRKLQNPGQTRVDESDPDGNQEDEGEDEDESDADPAPFKGAAPSSDRDSLFDKEDGDSDDSDNFIVADDDAAAPQLPMEYSMQIHQDISHQFKKVFQFLVHVAARPLKDRHNFMLHQMKNEEYFSVPLQIIQRKLMGLRDSLVSSSVWRPDFKKTIETYPEFETVPLDFATPYCDACHLGGRMSTLIGRASGIPYDDLGFEAKDESDSSNEDVDSKERVIEYHLGRFCARRTKVYHEFSHWEHTLFRIIAEEVEGLHAKSKQTGAAFYRVAFAGGKQPPEDLEDADSICEWLDERGIIDGEWHKIKAMMESARHLELVKGRGEDD